MKNKPETLNETVKDQIRPLDCTIMRCGGKSSVQEWTTVYMMCLSGHSSLQQCVSMCVCVYVFACVSGSFFISVG